MLTVGIPRGLLYHRYNILWEEFFNSLGVKYIISPESNFEILNKGKKMCIDETCLSLKLFAGHVDSLKDKCDYIFIPRMYSLEKKEQVCTNFNCLYDLIRNLYPNLKLIHYNIDVKRHKTEQKAYISLGKQLGFNKTESLKAYKYAKQKEQEYLYNIEKKQTKKLQNNKTKILLLGHEYNIKDALIGKNVTKFLLEHNIEVIYSYELPKENINTYSIKISPKVHWTMNKELLASFMYYKDKVDGTIIITSFPCGPDSLTNEIILRKKEKSKVLLLTFEDLSSDIAIITRLESFIDMIKGGIHS